MFQAFISVNYVIANENLSFKIRILYKTDKKKLAIDR